jgi:hypothetical protein
MRCCTCTPDADGLTDAQHLESLELFFDEIAPGPKGC